MYQLTFVGHAKTFKSYQIENNYVHTQFVNCLETELKKHFYPILFWFTEFTTKSCAYYSMKQSNRKVYIEQRNDFLVSMQWQCAHLHEHCSWLSTMTTVKCLSRRVHHIEKPYRIHKHIVVSNVYLHLKDFADRDKNKRKYTHQRIDERRRRWQWKKLK